MATARRLLLPALLALLVSAAGAARADYTCRPLDVPGSTWTQLWQLNNSGAIAAGSSLGGYTYSGGAWLAIPPLPAGSPFDQTNSGVLGVNDHGVLAGVISPPDGSVQAGFTLSGGTYAFFTYPSTTYTFTASRGIGNNGVVTGAATDPVGGGSVGFIYNPVGASGFAPGFTDVVPTLNGQAAWLVIPGPMNDAGQFVGSANFAGHGRYGFLYDPHATPTITTFRVNGGYTAARGINNRGEVVGFRPDATGTMVGYLLTAAGYQDIPCAQLTGSTGIYPESINDSGVITGCWYDAASNLRGFIAYPNVLLPAGVAGGAFTFDAAVSPNTPIFIDPAPAVGYRYAVGAGDPAFAGVVLPIGIGDSVYTLLAGDRAFTLAGGQRFDFAGNGFAGGVSAFTVVGIEPAADLDPANPTAFVTEVTFAAAGRFTGSMTPMTAADELADLVAAAARLARGKEPAERAREAQRAYAKGDVPETCEELGELVAWLGGKGARRFGAEAARALSAEAVAIREALSCPATAPEREEERR